jgi:hypothetical protein
VALKRMIRPPKKVRKPVVTRSTIKSIDDKYYGPEPIDISVKGFTEALNWYNYMFEHEETRPWLFEYLKKHDYSKNDVAAIKKLPKYRVSKTMCSVARILLNGNELPEVNMEYFNNSLKELIDAGNQTIEQAEEVASEKTVVSIQDRIKAKTSQLLTDCEEALDADPNLNIYEWLKGKEASTQAANAIANYYSKWIKDFEYVDPSYTREQKKHNADQLKYWSQFIYDCGRYVGNKMVTKVRKPKTIKLKPPSDLVKSLKFQKEFPPLKIVSCSPAEIIGAQQLWTYNTKTRKLTKYDAVGPGGIQVKGTTLTGFDVEKSSTKTLRKPEDTIQSLLSAGKVLIRKFMDELKTLETKPNGRINSDTILLRVIK